MEWRRPKAEDLHLFQEVHPELLGPDALTAGRAGQIWRALLTAAGFQAVVVTQSNAPSAEVVAGVGASVFVDDGFAVSELQNPRPGLNGRVLSGQLQDGSLAFSRSKIARANSSGGVNVIVLTGRWNRALMDEQQIQQARFTLSTAFAELHLGYRFKRLLVELIDEQDRQWASAIPVMRIHASFPGGTRALAIVEKSDLEGNEGTVLAQHFSCPLPRLFLRETDQELLLAALDNPTDEWLTRELGLGKEAVKRRWSALFERIDREMPELFECIKTDHGKGRGPQRRHVVLAYVRRHPQELRPFARVLAANRR